MRVCICLDANENMSDKCEYAIIFIGAHYRSVLRLRTVCNFYIELLGALDFSSMSRLSVDSCFGFDSS